MALITPLDNIPDTDSDASSWKQWHIALRDSFGRKTAAMIFVHAWNKRGKKSIINYDLTKYLDDGGIVLDNTYLGSVSETGASLLDNFTDILKVGKYAAYGIVGILVIGAGILIFNLVKNPIGAAKAAASLYPAGGATKLLK